MYKNVCVIRLMLVLTHKPGKKTYINYTVTFGKAQNKPINFQSLCTRQAKNKMKFSFTIQLSICLTCF